MQLVWKRHEYKFLDQDGNDVGFPLNSTLTKKNSCIGMIGWNLDCIPIALGQV